MKIIVYLFLALFIFGCGEKVEKEVNAETSKGTAATESIILESEGEFDPIANPKAVFGGTYTTWGSSFPKSLNMFLDSNSFSAEVTGMFFESLVGLHSTRNDPIGILAKDWSISDDKKTYTFEIHSEAEWSDGRPVTAEDVQFYYDVIMNPKNMTSIFRVDLKRFERPRIIDSKTIEIVAKEVHWSNFWSASGMVAFPKHVWRDVDFNKQNFEFPVVSGPYRLKEVKKNRYILLERRADWWGRIKKYNQYKYNFDFIRYKFMEDRNKALEAFKKGDFDAYAIYTSSIWAKQTDFDQVQKGWVVKQRIYNKEPKGFQGFAINLRRLKFQDVRVREALCCLMNRALMNEKLMFNEYFLLNSYYPDLFPENVNPDVPFRKYDPEKARSLLYEAGWRVGSDGVLEKDGMNLEISLLTYSVDQRHYNIYLEDLKKVGIKAGIEQLSLSSVRKKIDNHDFDLFWINWGASRLRDPEASWHSSTADQIATNNISGVKDSIIDDLIEQQKTEMSLDKRNEILRKIDKRLNEIVPYVFLWQADHHRILYWKRFGTPQYVFDKFSREESIPAYWWIDSDKDRSLRDAMKNNASLPLEPERVVYSE
ncbi:MAG: ABC transporter substrate-binding protein [Deltaproteobacteria bacterium]|nr:ABC transporter substrate-binding protein [Deltaproteobacteria bacterium]